MTTATNTTTAHVTMQEHSRKISSLELHHDGELCSERAKRYNLCEELLLLLSIAERSLSKGKTHVTEYQHERMREVLERHHWLMTNDR